MLPAWYVLDSVLKNVGGDFRELFAEGLEELFFHSFYRMPDGRTRLCHVFDTWKGFFPDPLLAAIRAKIPAPGTGPVVPQLVADGVAPAGPGYAQPSAVGGQPPEKRVKLDAVIRSHEKEIEVQTKQMLEELEQRIRRQGFGPTRQQLQELEELRGVLRELYAPPASQQAMPLPQVNPMALQALQAILSQQQNPAGAVLPQGHRPQQQHHQAPPQQQQQQQPPPQPVDIPLMAERSSRSEHEGFNPRALDPLYSIRMAGRPCPTCALRFKDEASYKEHLDWHFKQNKREQNRARGAQSRMWFLSASDWHAAGTKEATAVASSVAFEDSKKDDAAATAEAAKPRGRVPADESQKTCAVCTDPFEKVWDDDEQEWMYENAKKTEDGIIHCDCK